MKYQLLTIATVLVAGCAAQAPVYAPSTKPLQENLAHAQTHITESKTLAQRIHDKDVLIDRWNATHHK
jgi:hypothetical protein